MSADYLKKGKELYQHLPDIIEPTEARQLFESRVRFYGFQNRKAADGVNDHYVALGDQIYGNHSYHPVVRRIVAAQLKAHKSLYIGAFQDSTTFAAFCESILSGSVEGYVSLSIKALCDAYQVKVVRLTAERAYVMEEFFPHSRKLKKVLYISRFDDSNNYSMFKVADSLALPPIDSVSEDFSDFLSMASKKLLKKSREKFKMLETIVEPIDEHERLLQRLALYGFKMNKSKVSDDNGNCVFRAVSDQFFANENDHGFVRHVGVAQARSDYYKYYRLLGEEGDFEAYCASMSQTTSLASQKTNWADFTITQALSDAFNVKIVELVSNLTYSFMEYLPQGNRYKRVHGGICMLKMAFKRNGLAYKK